MMQKIWRLLILALIMSFSCQKKETPAPKAESEARVPLPGNPLTFEMQVLKDDGTGGIAITYLEGKNRRVEQYEIVAKLKRLKTITISTPEGSWVLNADNKTGVRMPAEESVLEQSENAPSLPKWSDVLEGTKQDAGIKTKKRGVKEWEGADYTVYHLSHPAGKAEVDYYVDQNDEIRRIISYDGKGRVMEDIRMTLKRGPLPPDIFQPPPDFKIQEMTKKK